MGKKPYIHCDKHPDCFAHRFDGTCFLLEDNDFGNRDCPFYKSKEQVKLEKESTQARLESLGIKTSNKKKKSEEDNGC